MVRRSGIRVNGSGWEEWEQEKVRVEEGGVEAEVQRWSEMVKQRKRSGRRRCIASREPALSTVVGTRKGIGRRGLRFE